MNALSIRAFTLDLLQIQLFLCCALYTLKSTWFQVPISRTSNFSGLNSKQILESNQLISNKVPSSQTSVLRSLITSHWIIFKIIETLILNANTANINLVPRVLSYPPY